MNKNKIRNNFKFKRWSMKWMEKRILLLTGYFVIVITVIKTTIMILCNKNKLKEEENKQKRKLKKI